MTQIDVLKMAIEAGLAAETSDGRHQIWYPDNLCHFANLVAAKEREALAQTQEPVAWEQFYPDIGKPQLTYPPQQGKEPVAIVHIKDDCLVGSHRDNSKPFPDGQYGLWPIGTTPPQRTWVGLNTDEMKEIADRYHLKPPNVPVAFRTIEVKLKQKNT